MNRKPNKKHVYLTGAQKKDMIGQFIDGYNAEELAARFDVSYKTAIKVLRPTRVASEEATDFILGLSLVHKVSRKEAVDMVIKSAREKYATI